LKSTCTGGGALGLNCHDACVEDYSLFEWRVKIPSSIMTSLSAQGAFVGLSSAGQAVVTWLFWLTHGVDYGDMEGVLGELLFVSS
jgi:hypothetical protein